MPKVEDSATVRMLAQSHLRDDLDGYTVSFTSVLADIDATPGEGLDDRRQTRTATSSQDDRAVRRP
jgi:hypothetical protein